MSKISGATRENLAHFDFFKKDNLACYVSEKVLREMIFFYQILHHRRTRSE